MIFFFYYSMSFCQWSTQVRASRISSFWWGGFLLFLALAQVQLNTLIVSRHMAKWNNAKLYWSKTPPDSKSFSGYTDSKILISNRKCIPKLPQKVEHGPCRNNMKPIEDLRLIRQLISVEHQFLRWKHNSSHRVTLHATSSINYQSQLFNMNLCMVTTYHNSWSFTQFL